jgi:choline-sulfatase
MYMKSSPNVLIIMSDDQGPWAMGCAGTPELKTPALDGLASEGMRFDNFHCASPVCSPARASFLTGRIPSSHGIHDWLKKGNIEVEEGVTWSGEDSPIEYLQGQLGFTQVLAENGYVCGLSGKWHLGDSANPQKGHNYWCAHSLGGGNYRDFHFFDNKTVMEHSTDYVTDLFTDRALDFLDTHGTENAPFCLSVHYTAPHTPWIKEEQPEEIWSSYDSCDFPSIPVLPAHPWRGWDPTPEKRKESLQGYFTTITAMDANISRILTKLDELEIAEDTLVIFTSDNGYNLGHHGIHGKGNGTYPMNMFDESVKVPFIARLPGRIPGGTINHGFVSAYDFMPTLLDFLDIENPVSEDLPGRSFADLLNGGNGSRGPVVVCDEYGPVRMIREERWKYVHRYPDGPHELYDMSADPGETTNRMDDESLTAVIARLRTGLENWYDRYSSADYDGKNLPVTGEGQLDSVGSKGKGRKAFAP